MERPKIIIMLGAITAAIGAWFWLEEFTYARDNGSELAAKLQWVGVAVAMACLAIVLVGRELRDHSRPSDQRKHESRHTPD